MAAGHVHAMSLDRKPLFDFERDALHRETARHYGPQQQTRQYDVMGRLTCQQRLLGEEAKQQRLYHYTQSSELYGIDDSLKGETRYRYDPIGRLKAASTPLGEESFAFDPAGNLVDPELQRKAEQHRDSQITGTAHGILGGIRDTGRRLHKVMGNLLQYYTGTHYQYDDRGNRRRQTELSGHTTEYVYDADDRLIEAKRYRRAPAAGDTTPPEMHAKYGYDGFGRRLWKLVKEGNAKPKLTVFSWDANLLTSEEVFEGEFHFWDTFAYPKEPELEPEDPSKKFSLPIAQRVHTLTARPLKRTHWLYEPESFIPAAQLVDAYDQHAQRMTGTGSVAYSSTVSAETATAEPQLYYIHTDHLGTPQELTDREGNLQWVGHYRAWGELAKANDSVGNASSVEMPLRFQGQYFDAETGLHYNRFRYYDPQIGRFTTQDPISLAGGVNLYQYAPNPVRWVDPLGLEKIFRGMMDDGGFPKTTPSARGLGARLNSDIPVDINGNVHPNMGGVSVSPSPDSLPRHRKPSEFGGTGKDPVWQMNTSDLGNDLVHVPDSKTHGTIQPSRTMSADEYQKALAETQGKWKKCP